MDLKKDLIKQISSDLKISKFNDEEQDDYLNRLLYSAIAVWMIQSTGDQSFNVNYNKRGVSKSYLTRKISKIVLEYIAIFPSFRVFLDGLTEVEFASLLRENYEKAGYIVPVGFDEFVIASPTKTAKVNDSWLLIRNNFKSVATKAIGLGSFLEKHSEEEFCSLHELFYLPKLNAQKWTVEYIKRLKWVDATKLGMETQFFDAKRMKSFSESWIEQFPEYCEVTLYRKNNWDYGFAKKNNTDIVGIKIPEWLIGQGNNESEKLFDNDVRRFMYGLKAINDNRIKSIAYKKTGYFELKLFNALPTRELTALQFLGWRKKGILDEYNYIFPCELFDSVKNLLEKLLIVIEEKQI
jgi:hypothetical protein